MGTPSPLKACKVFEIDMLSPDLLRTSSAILRRNEKPGSKPGFVLFLI
jgi:hypothetical protein